MNKTTNYHLPQWEAHDPVRREDFNRMCANIETGLTDLRDDQSTLARLRRMGYDLYQAVGRCLGAGVPGVSLKGAALNCLTSSDELSRVSGMARTQRWRHTRPVHGHDAGQTERGDLQLGK